MKPPDRWHPTLAHARAVVGGVSLTLAAVLGRRPDLLVLATPLIAAAAWAVVVRPTTLPSVRQSIDHGTLYEGQATTWRVSFEDPEGRVDDVAVLVEPSAWVDRDPGDGQVAVDLRKDGDAGLRIGIRSTRWGCRRAGPALIVASSGWAGFQWWSRNGADAARLVTLPQSSRFDAAAPPVRTPGLIGAHRSPREGSGTEFATVRPFQPGDRLRRIHWAHTLRTGTVHVTTTWADHDRNIVLLIDALEEIGGSEGIDGRASSLDVSVRAATAIAEHYIRVGDRVGLAAFGARGVQRCPPAAGARHLRRLLEVMVDIEPARARADDGRVPRGLGRNALVVLLSPLMTSAALQRAVTIANHGTPILVIDCLPTDIAHRDPGEPYAELSWRVELLRRERNIRRAREAGVAVVPWRGPGSLDLVLRDLYRHSSGRTGRSR